MISFKKKKKNKIKFYSKEMRERMFYRIGIFGIIFVIIKTILNPSMITIITNSFLVIIFAISWHYIYKFLEKNEHKDVPFTTLLAICLIIVLTIIFVFVLAIIYLA